MSELIYLYMYQHRESGKAYVGVTSNPQNRFKRHAIGKSAAVAFNRAVQKYGIDSFSHHILAVFDDIEAANYHENAAIKAFGTLSPNGYNLVGGAPRSKYFGCHSDETKEKIGAAQRGKIISDDALRNLREAMRDPEVRSKISRAMKGKKPAAITIEKRKEKYTGVPLSPEHRAKISAGVRKSDVLERVVAASRGRVVFQETRDKMSKSRKGKTRTPEHCGNLSRALTGNKLTQETKTKISKAHKGKSLSDEHRAKIALALRQYWASKEKTPNV